MMVAHDDCANDGEMDERRDSFGGMTDDGMKARRRDDEDTKVQNTTARQNDTDTSAALQHLMPVALARNNMS